MKKSIILILITALFCSCENKQKSIEAKIKFKLIFDKKRSYSTLKMIHLVTQIKNNTDEDIYFCYPRTTYATSLIEEEKSSKTTNKGEIFVQNFLIPDSSVVDYKFYDKIFNDYTYFFSSVAKSLSLNSEKTKAYNIILGLNKKCMDANKESSFMKNSFIFLKKGEVLEIDNTPILLHDLKKDIKSVKYQVFLDKEFLKNILKKSCYNLPNKIDSFSLWNGEIKSDTLEMGFDLK